MSYLYVMIGAPATGKTTYRKHLAKFNSHKGFEVISLDDFVLEQAKRDRVKPETIYEGMLPTAQTYIAQKARSAFATKRPVIWDTHDTVSKEVRAAILAAVPRGYRKIAVVFSENLYNHHEREPTFVARAALPVDPVTEDEGWDEIRRQVM